MLFFNPALNNKQQIMAALKKLEFLFFIQVQGG